MEIAAGLGKGEGVDASLNGFHDGQGDIEDDAEKDHGRM